MKKLLLSILIGCSSVAFGQGDDCATAIIVGSNDCSGAGAYNNTGITGTMSAGSCFTGGNNNGMWFEFLATSPVANINVNGTTLTTPQIMLLEPPAGGCASTDPFLELDCDSPGGATASVSSSSLTVGNTYYIYVDGQNNSVGTFEVCVTSPPQPLNDSPCSPYVVPANNFCSSPGAYTNNGASDDNLFSVGYPACWDGTGNLNTVFFEFTAIGPFNEITVNGTTLTNPQISIVETADCSGTDWTNNGASNCASGIGTSVTMNANNLIAGTTYLIAVDGAGNNTGNFQLCVNSYVPTAGPPNDLCDNAIQLCPGGYYVSTTDQATATDAINVNDWSCNAVLDNVVWFSFVANTPVEDVVFDISASCTGTASSHILQFGVFEYTGGGLPCDNPGSPPSFAGIECDASINGTGSTIVTVPAASMVAGETYWINVDNWPGDACDFEFSVTGNAGANAGPDSFICDSDGTINLNESPAGGIWTGPGITDNVNGIFDPSLTGPGNFTLFYTQGVCTDQTLVSISGVDVATNNDLTICAGESVDLIGSVTAINATAPVTFSNTTDYAINDLSTTSSTINVTGISPTNVGSNPIVSVCLNIDHTFDGDLDISLMCPNGTVIYLSSDNGGGGNNYTGTCFYAGLPSITSGGAPFTGDFSPEEPFSNLSGCDVNGTWTLQVYDDAGGDTGTLLDWEITFNNTISPTFSWSPTTDMVNSGTLNPTVTPSVTTTYTLTGDIPAGCPSTDQVTVNVVTSGDPSFTLAGTCTGATANITGDAGGTFTFTTPPGDGALINGSTGEITNAVAGTTYDVTYTLPGSCGGFLAQQVTLPLSDNATFTIAATCDGGVATLDAAATTGGNFTFAVAPGDGAMINGSTGEITGGTSGATYQVTYATSGSCPASTTESVTANLLDDPSFNLSPNCTGGTATITGTPGGTFSFTVAPGDGASINSTSGEVTGGTPGATYNITYATSGACANSSAQNLTVLSADNATFTMTPTCDGGTATLDAAATTGGTFTFAVAPGDGASINGSTGAITGGTSGLTYQVTYTTGGTCSVFSTMSVTATSADNATFTMTPTCDGGTATLDAAATTGGTFTFAVAPGDGASINGSSGAVTGGTPGSTYQVTYTTSGACPTFSTISVTATSSDNATFTMTPTCDGGTATLDAAATTGGTFTFAVAPGDGASINGATGAVTGGTSGSTYQVTYTTSGACPTFSTIGVTATSSDNATFTMTPTCDGGTATLDAAATTGGTFTFAVAPGDGASINGSTGAVTGGTSGSTYQVTYTTIGACSTFSTISVTATSADNATFTMTPTCDGGTATLDAAATAGGTFTFAVAPGDGASINGSTGAITGGTPGSTYQVTYTTSGACTAFSTISVTATSADNATFTMTPTCDGGVATLDAAATTGGTFTFAVAPGDGATINGSTGVVTGGTSGSTYQVTYTTSGACTAFSTISVTANTIDDASFTLTPNCFGATASITGTPGGLFDFTVAPGDGAIINSSNGTITNGSSGMTYNVTYATSGACANSSSESVTVLTTPGMPAVFVDTTYCVTEVIEDVSALGSGGTYTWYSDINLTNPLATGASYSPSEEIGVVSYYVTETVNGCEGPANVVTIEIVGCDITLPTAFSPNGDGNNDAWEILDLDLVYPDNVVKVYNRWGNLIFEHRSDKGANPYNDPNNRWDGTYNGELLPVGSYFFIVEFNDKNNESLTGAVSIIME